MAYQSPKTACTWPNLWKEGDTKLSSNLCSIILEDFLKNSWSCVEALVKEVGSFKEEKRKPIELYYFKDGQKNDVTFDGSRFFLRCSVEYANPQLTVEDVQGIIATRLLEVCTNYFQQRGLHQPTSQETEEICTILKKPPPGTVVSFLLNTDDIEADRYSMNPLKQSIVDSGQSAFPAATVKTENLRVDEKFVQKYEGSLFCKKEIESIEKHLKSCGNSYVNMVDAVKYEHLARLSEAFGIDLAIYSMRLPLAALEKESTDGLLHHIIREAHKDYQSFENIYKCMGRSMKNLTTLLTIPHSPKGYGSKRAARGRIYFDGTKLKNVKVDYRTTLLYPNAIDPSDISIAQADDSFTVEADKLVDYNFKETPSSPQFFLYSLGSPENAVVWHGIGAFGASELLKSYTTTRVGVSTGQVINGLYEKFGVTAKIPLQFNLVPKYMWFHPVHRNIDASIGCVQDLKDLADLGMKMEHLPEEQYVRKPE
jgi:hypothetical protein